MSTTARKVCYSVRRSTHQPLVGDRTAFAVFTNDNRESIIVFPFSKCTDALEFAKQGGDIEWVAPIKPVKKPWTGGFLAQQNKAMDAIHASEAYPAPAKQARISTVDTTEAEADRLASQEIYHAEEQKRIQTLEESYFEDEEDALVSSLVEID